VCFVRKNKTLGACFNSKSVLQLLERNYRVLCAASTPPKVGRGARALEKSHPVPPITLPSPSPDVSSRASPRLYAFQPIASDFDIKSFVLGVLEEAGYSEKRARHLDQDDFLAYVGPPLIYFPAMWTRNPD
jgi:18S rRNA (adenine1779-N6/adenine1780-N6)-dimethyltransferase